MAGFHDTNLPYLYRVYYQSLLILAFLCPFLAFSQVKGTVYDELTGDAMAYVKVSCGAQSVYTNINGFFEFDEASCDSIELRYVGYKDTLVQVGPDFSNYYLLPQTKAFKDLVVKSENPAYRIMREALKHKKENNPLKRSFEYTAYNKFYFTISMDSVSLEEDSIFGRLYNMLQSHYLIFTESVVKRQRINNRKDRNTILYERTSGFEHNALSVAATELQSFGQYSTYIDLAGTKFLNPLSTPGIQKYEMELEDYVLEGKDTVFTIRFEPKSHKLDGVKGHYKINSNNYAVQYADVQPIVATDDIQIHIKQIYSYYDSLWFPTELNTVLVFGNVGDNGMIGSGRSVIQDLSIQPDLSEVKFSHLSTEKAIDPKLDIEQYRDPLSKKEQRTYEAIDSLGEANKFDKKLEWTSSLFTSRIPMGPVDLAMNHLLDFNNIEGVRLGLGLVTNKKISKRFELGGYGAYGFKDKEFKYGAHGSLFIAPKYQTKLSLQWQNDIQFWTGYPLVLYQEAPSLDKYLINLFYRRADYTERYAAHLESRVAKHFKLRLTAEHRQHTRKDTNYLFYEKLNGHVEYGFQDFDIAELSAEVRFVFNEKFVEFFGTQISEGSNAPEVYLKYTHAIDNRWGDVACTGWDLLFNYRFKLPFSGQSTFYLKASTRDRSLPLPLTPALDGAYRRLSVAVPYAFETMNNSAFFADRYVSGGLLYNLGRLYKTPSSAPELVLAGKAAIGDMHNPELHQNYAFNVPRHWYAESGLYLNNVLVSGVSGVGIGGFYRLGKYAVDDWKDNIAIKFTLNLNF